VQPRRNVVFAFFDGEETGKYGSKHFISIVDTPYLIAKHDPPVFMLNFDMVGRVRDHRLQISGFATSSKLKAWVSNAHNELPHLKISKSSLTKMNSDQASFLAYGVPVLNIFSGYHKDYHQPTDDFKKVNLEGVAEAAKLGYLIAKSAALDTQDLSKMVNPNNPFAAIAAEKIGLTYHRGDNRR